MTPLWHVEESATGLARVRGWVPGEEQPGLFEQDQEISDKKEIGNA